MKSFNFSKYININEFLQSFSEVQFQFKTKIILLNTYITSKCCKVLIIRIIFLKVLITWFILLKSIIYMINTFPGGHFRKSINYAISTFQKVLIMHLIHFKSIIRIIYTFFKQKSIKRVINTFTKVLNDRLNLFRVTFRTFWFRVYARFH